MYRSAPPQQYRMGINAGSISSTHRGDSNFTFDTKKLPPHRGWGDRPGRRRRGCGISDGKGSGNTPMNSSFPASSCEPNGSGTSRLCQCVGKYQDAFGQEGDDRLLSYRRGKRIFRRGGLITMKALIFDGDKRVTKTSIFPGDMAAEVKKYRDILIEDIAETDD